jgi:serine phosphatase RsbU (regulator of sigma subunit)
MTLKGIPPETILLEINSKLCEKLPSNLFFAACFIEFNEHGRRFKIWNCGLPDQILLRGGSYWRSHPSDSLALGIIEEWEPNLMDAIDLQPGDRIYAFSDGVLEISSPDGELFGAERLQQALCDIVNRGEALETLLDRVAQFHGSKEHQDDITLLEVTVPA